MKKVIISILMMICLASFGQQVMSVRNFNITNAGATVVLDPTLNEIPDLMVVSASSPATLVADYEINASSIPAVGIKWRVFFDLTDVTLNGHSVIFFGQTILPSMMLTMGYFDFFIYDNPALVGYCYAPYNFNEGNLVLNGAIIQNGTIPLSALDGAIPLTSLDTIGRGRIIYGAASNVMSSQFAGGSGKILIGDGTDVKSLAVTGDVSVSSSAVTTIDSVIVDADIKTGAEIKRQKLAAGTGSYVLINTAAGYVSEEATLNPSRGGLGANVSGSTGFVTFSAGSSTVGNISESESFIVSFETGEQCANRFKMPCAGTVTGFYAVCVKAISATDNGTIVLKNAAGTTMTAGTITFTASDPLETAYSVTPSANNTFSAGDILYATTAKTTAGGKALITVTYTRSN